VIAGWLRGVLLTLRKEQTIGLAYQPSDSRRSQLGLFLSLAIVVPLVTILSTHLWLRSAYTSNVFHLQGFLDQYGRGIYRYRILGRDLLLRTYRLLASHRRDQPFSMPTDPDATLLFYGSYVLLNAIFFFFSNLFLLVLLWDWKKGITDLRLAHYFFLVLLLALSTYAVTPYDQLAYFLMLACFLALRIRTAWIMYVVLGVAAIAGGLNRETEFLVTSALWTVAIFAAPKDSKRYFRAGLFHLLLFAACYVGLRFLLPGAPAIAAGLTFGGKWPLPSLAVVCVLFSIAVSMAVREYPNRKPSIVLLVLSAPYVITILVGGQIRELRLLIPLLLCVLFVYVQLAHARMQRSAFDTTPG
jgi:hypothetical protein